MCGGAVAAAFGAAEFRAATGVSRETIARLERYVALLARWNRAVNLVAATSLADVWRRHFLDSAQLLPLAPSGARAWLDLGSGAGLPGLVLAALGAPEVHLIESDARKCAFVTVAAGEMGVSVRVHRQRIERVVPWPADVVVARAVAPLPRLLDLAAPFFGPTTVGLFLKGEDVERELTVATRSWRMHAERIASRSDKSGVIVRIQRLSRV
ncbi:MAG: 16S rRNA (guanine(527)-N(7))-methyltransferase RsmG [Alphaproteobacteria bacterium]|nr:16S rRNA (guanine(527)-N(7))-methyltransferase RsmG [Alphaproteobacteria bacterium]